MSINPENCNYYSDWIKFIDEGRVNKLRERRRPARNTWAIKTRFRGKQVDCNAVAIRFHNTDIITITEQNDVILNSGGWRTVSTKDRLNRFTPRSMDIWQDQKIWWVTVGRMDTEGVTVPYADGITISIDGEITGEGNDPKRLLALDKRIRSYAKSFIKKFFNGGIPKPSQADCFFCSHVDVKTNRPVYEAKNQGGLSCILSHIDEGYYVPSLLYQAITHSRALMSPFAKGVVHEIWNEGKTFEPDRGMHGIGRDQIYKSLVRYLRLQCGIAT